MAIELKALGEKKTLVIAKIFNRKTRKIHKKMKVITDQPEMMKTIDHEDKKIEIINKTKKLLLNKKNNGRKRGKKSKREEKKLIKSLKEKREKLKKNPMRNPKKKEDLKEKGRKVGIT